MKTRSKAIPNLLVAVPIVLIAISARLALACEHESLSYEGAYSTCYRTEDNAPAGFLKVRFKLTCKPGGDAPYSSDRFIMYQCDGSFLSAESPFVPKTQEAPSESEHYSQLMAFMDGSARVEKAPSTEGDLAKAWDAIETSYFKKRKLDLFRYLPASSSAVRYDASEQPNFDASDMFPGLPGDTVAEAPPAALPFSDQNYGQTYQVIPEDQSAFAIFRFFGVGAAAPAPLQAIFNLASGPITVAGIVRPGKELLASPSPKNGSHPYLSGISLVRPRVSASAPLTQAEGRALAQYIYIQLNQMNALVPPEKGGPGWYDCATTENQEQIPITIFDGVANRPSRPLKTSCHYSESNSGGPNMRSFDCLRVGESTCDCQLDSDACFVAPGAGTAGEVRL